MLNLFVLDADTGDKIPAGIRPANAADFAATETWQTDWTSEYVDALPNKVALYRDDDQELLGLMS